MLNATKPSHFARFWQGAPSPLRPPRKTTPERPKVAQTWCVLHILTSKCASRHNCVHFFRHLNFQTCSENGVFCTCQLRNVLRATTACTFFDISTSKRPGVFCTFWLRNVLCATTACTFSTSQLPKVVQTWCVLHILTSKCALRHNGVHFFDISTSKSGPNPWCFVHFDF